MKINNNNSKRKHKYKPNKTKKTRNDLTITKSINLSKGQRDIVCKNYFNKYDTFEDKIEETFKKNKIDFFSTNYNLEKQLLRDFKEASQKSNINPRTDFYSYINDKWLKDFEVQETQKYIVQVDNFRITQDKVFRELVEIVKDYIKGNDTPLAKNMKKYFQSVMKQNTVKQANYYATYFVNNVDELRKDKNTEEIVTIRKYVVLQHLGKNRRIKNN